MISSGDQTEEGETATTSSQPRVCCLVGIREASWRGDGLGGVWYNHKDDNVYPRSLQIELVVCILFAVVAQITHSSNYVPFINSRSNPNDQRPIPFMITTNSQDIIINLTHNNEFISKDMVTIPDYLLVFIGIILPTFIIITTSFALAWLHDRCRQGCSTPSSTTFSSSSDSIMKHTLYDIHSAICLLTISYGGTRFFTDFVKSYVGYLRPNFYTMCQFNMETMTCDASESLINSARRSFPSGHASISFCGMMCLALYLAGKVGLHSYNHHKSHQEQLMQQQSHCPDDEAVGVQEEEAAATPTTTTTHNHCYGTTTTQSSAMHKFGLKLLWKKIAFLFAIGGPLFLSTFVAASRVHDNWHHPADVVAGALIGATCALVAYHLW